MSQYDYLRPWVRAWPYVALALAPLVIIGSAVVAAWRAAVEGA